jgi:hypothetical protein
MSTDAKQLERNQRRFLPLWQYRFFIYDHVTYEDFPQILDLHICHSRRYYLNALSFISIYSVQNVARLFWILPVFEFFPP